MDVTRMSVDQLPNMLCLVRFGSAYIENGDMRARASSTAHRRFSICYCHHFCSYLMPTCFFASTIVTFCQKWTWAQRKKNLTRAKYSMQIWFNQIQSQQLYSKRKSKNFVAFGVKCDWKLAILQISWIVWMVACWFFALPLSLTPCSNHSMMINIFSRFMTTENPSRPKKNVSRFCFGYHWTHSHIDSDFNFLLRSIHPFKSIICFCYGRHRNLFLLFSSHSLYFFTSPLDISCSLSFESRILQIVHMKLRTESFCQKIH